MTAAEAEALAREIVGACENAGLANFCCVGSGTQRACDNCVITLQFRDALLSADAAGFERGVEEAAAGLVALQTNPSEIRLHVGELSGAEMRLTRAVLGWLSSYIRALSTGGTR